MKDERLIFPSNHFEGGPTEEETKINNTVELSFKRDDEAFRDALSDLKEDASLETAERREVLLEAVKSELKSYFGQFGITPHVPESEDVFYLKSSREMEDLDIPDNLKQIGVQSSHASGQRQVEFVWFKLGNYENVPADLLEIIEAKHVAHESYHLTAPTKFAVERTQDGYVNAKIERQGLYYDEHLRKQDPLNGIGGGILEEGMAMLFQDWFFRKATLSQMPPREARWFNETIKGISLQLNIPEESITITRADNKGVEIKFVYEMHIRITKLLKQKVDTAGYNFEQLVEDARINNKTISLAKAIEQVGGEGMYRRISTCVSVTEAEKILAELQAED